ncbi:hypothetical protein EHS25_008123 [Saitozyma podzolica]|uniref:Large ribosomal subunit protein mL49 n=1 Tax=Saitozyma podzolica TaxID=1890683 RepID=A0A427YNH6_9TREE|nr:hypothetical protein EHS25_008123 [Saitozyma podzolica]
MIARPALLSSVASASRPRAVAFTSPVFLRAASTSTATSSTPTPTPTASTSASGSGSASASAASPLPEASDAAIPEASPEYASTYFVPRTENGQLPVYSKVRNGGGWRTIVRKVEGDVTSLQSDLNAYLSEMHVDPLKPPPAFSQRPTNRHLEVRGNWVGEIKAWMEGRGF